MALVRLKQKGQMTIPADIRARLQLRAGDLFEATTEGSAIVLIPKRVIDRTVAEDEPLVLTLKPR